MNQSSSLPVLQPPSVVSLPVSTPNRRASTLFPSTTSVLPPSPSPSALTTHSIQNPDGHQDYYSVGPVDGTKTPVKLSAKLKSYLPSTESIKRLRPIKSFSKLKSKALGTTTKTPIVSNPLFTSFDPNLEGSSTGSRAPQLWSLSTGSKPLTKRPGLSSCIRPGLLLDSPPGQSIKQPFKLDKDIGQVIEIGRDTLLGKLSFEQQPTNDQKKQIEAEKEREAWKKRKSKTGVSWEERLEMLDVCRGEISFESKAGDIHDVKSKGVVTANTLKTTTSTGKNAIPNVQNLPEIVRSNKVMSRRLSRHGLRPSKSFDLDSRLSTIESSPPTSPTDTHNKPDRTSNSRSIIDYSSTLPNFQSAWTRHGYRKQVRAPVRMASAVSLPPLVPIPPLDPTPPDFPLNESFTQVEQPTSNPIGALYRSSVPRPAGPSASPFVIAPPHTSIGTVANSQTTTTPSTAPTPVDTQPDRPGSIWRSQIIGRYYDTSGFLEGSETEIDPSPLKGIEHNPARTVSLIDKRKGGMEEKENKEDLPPRLESPRTFSPILFSLDFSLSSENSELLGSFAVEERKELKEQNISAFTNPSAISEGNYVSSSKWSPVGAQLSFSPINPFRVTTSITANATQPDFLNSLEASSSVLPYRALQSPSPSSNPVKNLSDDPLHSALPIQPVEISLALAQRSLIIDPTDIPLPSSPSDEISGFSFSAYATLWTPPRQNQPQSHHAANPDSSRISLKPANDQAKIVISSSSSSSSAAASSSASSSLSTTSSIIDESGDFSVSSNLEVEVKFGTASRLTSSIPRVVYQSPLLVESEPLPSLRLHSDHNNEDERGEDKEESDDENERKYQEGGLESEQDLSPCVARSIFLSSRVPKKPMEILQTWKPPTPSKPSGLVNKAGPVASSPSASVSNTPSLAFREKNRSSLKLNSSLIAEFGQGALSTSTPTASEVSLQMFRRRIKDALETGAGDSFVCSSVETSQVESEPGSIDQFLSELFVEGRTQEDQDPIQAEEHEEKGEGENEENEHDDSFTYALDHPEEAVEIQFNLKTHHQADHVSSPRYGSSTHVSTDMLSSPVTPYSRHQRQLEHDLEDDHGHSSDLGSTGKEIMRLAREKGQTKLLKRMANRSIRNELESNRKMDRKRLRT